MIHKAGNRAATLTRQLLAFSRRQVLEPKVFNLNSVVAEISKLLQRMIGEDVVLSVVPAANLHCIRADQGRIEQVLMNLAVNARDAMSQGGKLTIETRNVVLDDAYANGHPEVRPGPYVLLAVSDTGCGMDEATRKRIFEPFFTTKEVGKGTGLGLATVYGIIKQSGGHIAVYSEPNRGSTFKIYLPSTEEKAAPSSSYPRPKFLPRGKGTVLLVEDEDMVRTLSSQVLQEHGYTVLEAWHGKEALALSERDLSAVQLTVTDVVMPEMDGRDLAKRLLSRKPDMKVLYVSGYTAKAIVRNGILEPDTIFLEKPFTPEGLVRKVHEMLGA
jgi:CheY-like chemotaxis protein